MAAMSTCGRGEGDHLGEAHAGVEAEAEGVARHRVAHRGLEVPVPARKHLGRRLDAAAARAARAVQPPAGGAPQPDPVAQILGVEARSAVDGAQQLHRDVGLHSSGPFGNLPESLLDVAEVDAIERAVEPVAEVLVNGAAVDGDGAVPAPWSNGEIVLEGLTQGGHGPAAGAVAGRVLAQVDAAEDFPGAAARLIGGDGPGRRGSATTPSYPA